MVKGKLVVIVVDVVSVVDVVVVVVEVVCVVDPILVSDAVEQLHAVVVGVVKGVVVCSVELLPGTPSPFGLSSPW